MGSQNSVCMSDTRATKEHAACRFKPRCHLRLLCVKHNRQGALQQPGASFNVSLGTLSLKRLFAVSRFNAVPNRLRNRVRNFQAAVPH